MAVDVESLAAYCGADAVQDSSELVAAIAVAQELVDLFLTNAWRTPSDYVQDEAVKRVAYAVFKTGDSTANSWTTMGDGTQVMGPANDPMSKAYPLLRKYVNRV